MAEDVSRAAAQAEQFVRELLRRFREIAREEARLALQGVVQGGRVPASKISGSIPTGTHNLFSDRHPDVDHTDTPADGDVLTYSAAAGKWVAAQPGAAQQDVTINYVIDGGGAAIATGSKGYVMVDFAATILAATVLADQTGSIVVDIRKSDYAGFPTMGSICGSAKPTLSNARKNQDTTLSGWTTTINAGDILEYVVESAATVQRVTVALKVRRN